MNKQTYLPRPHEMLSTIFWPEFLKETQSNWNTPKNMFKKIVWIEDKEGLIDFKSTSADIADRRAAGTPNTWHKKQDGIK